MKVQLYHSIISTIKATVLSKVLSAVLERLVCIINAISLTLSLKLSEHCRNNKYATVANKLQVASTVANNLCWVCNQSTGWACNSMPCV